eukprot:CAMPEP_0197854748 /NCGR_PEP_ID=MMETSP1438-20131217/25266_1 /TAXON_ID=1461541 /ORGANISM="Pterosperma sp., Strain CCMP1384" /LENGTH=55 /DNA_ID=CAMNT_0043469607 /DNA_START=83 /DNA_END=246 /DNA_ORIENTATION=+
MTKSAKDEEEYMICMIYMNIYNRLELGWAAVGNDSVQWTRRSSAGWAGGTDLRHG